MDTRTTYAANLLIELTNLCSDPEKTIFLEPTRRDICIEFKKRVLRFMQLKLSLEELEKISDNVGRVDKSDLVDFLLHITSPYISYVEENQYNYVNCIVTNDLLIDYKLIESPGILSIPITKAIPYIYSKYLNCNFIQ